MLDFTIEQVVTDRFSMEYIHFGTGKTPMVVLPGLGVKSVIESAPAVVSHYRKFKSDFSVYVPERRSEIPQDYDNAQMAKDTAQALKTLGLHHVCLFGVSQGGMIAMLVTSAFPELVSCLSLCSTAMTMNDERFRVIRNWIRLAEHKDKEGLFLSFGKNIYPASIFEQNRQAFVEISKTVTDKELNRFVQLAKAIEGSDASSVIGNIRCPVQLSFDENDTVLGKDPASEMRAHFSTLPQFEERRFNGYGHALYDTCPDFLEWLYRFFMRMKAS